MMGVAWAVAGGSVQMAMEAIIVAGASPLTGLLRQSCWEPSIKEACQEVAWLEWWEREKKMPGGGSFLEEGGTRQRAQAR